MERRARLRLTGAMALALAATIALAQDVQEPGGKTKPKPDKPARAGGGKKVTIDKALEGMSLTEVQASQVTSLWNTYKQDMANWESGNAAAFKELKEKMKQAKEANDQDALKALSEEQAKLNAPRQAKREELEKQFRAILPEEQTVSLLVALGLRKPPRLGEELHVLMARFHELKLTAEQEEKIKGAIQQAHTVIVAGILTPEQRDILKSPPSKPVKGGAKAPAVK